MKNSILLLAMLAFAGLAQSSFGAEPGDQTTVVFAVDNMTCASCPISVRKAMQRVDGVKAVKVDFAAKTATVIFDPSAATASDIGDASTNVGFPATVLADQ